MKTKPTKNPLDILNEPVPVEALSDERIVELVCDAARGAAILNSRNRRKNPYDDACRALYDESVRRDKPGLYKKGHDEAKRSFGFQ